VASGVPMLIAPRGLTRRAKRASPCFGSSTCSMTSCDTTQSYRSSSTALSEKAADDALGRFLAPARRGLGARDRNPYQLELHGDAGHRQRAGRSGINVASYEDFYSRPTRRSTRATRRGAHQQAGRTDPAINTAIFSEQGGYQGIGFAVPSNLARRVMNDLIEFGEVRRGSVGRFAWSRSRATGGGTAPAQHARCLVWQMSRDSDGLRGRHPSRGRHRGVQRQSVDDPRPSPHRG